MAERRPGRHWFFWFARTLLLLVVRLAFGLRVEGAERVPREGGVVVAGNHSTSWDPPVLGVAVPRAVSFMAKKELFERRWFALLLRNVLAFPVDRGRSDLGAVRNSLRLLAAGMAVGVFAQGTRNAGDAEALDGAAFLAARAGVPLQPAAVWREGRSFRVRFGEPIPPQGRGWEDVRRMTRELVVRINALLPPGLGSIPLPADDDAEAGRPGGAAGGRQRSERRDSERVT